MHLTNLLVVVAAGFAAPLGVLVPVLEDSGTVASTFRQLVIAAASIADFAAVILLSLFFSREATSTPIQFVLLGHRPRRCR